MSQSNSFDLVYLLALIRKNFLYLIAVIVLAGILAVIFTMPFFYAPEYRSSTTIFPTNPERYDLVNLFKESPVYLYGGSKELERLDNIANSKELKIFVMDSLDLWASYDIDKASSASPEYYGLLNYDSKVSTKRVDGNGLEIIAFDTDPQTAADIVNLLVAEIDRRNKNLLSANNQRILEVYRSTALELNAQIRAYEDSTREVRKEYSIFDTERQTEVVLGQVMHTEAKLAGERAKLAAYKNYYAQGDTAVVHTEARIAALQQQVNSMVRMRSGSNINLEKFQIGLDKIRSYEAYHLRMIESWKMLGERIEYLEMMLDTRVSTILTVETALPSDRKARPVRGLILAATLLLSALLSIIGLVVIDQIKNYQAKSN